jgi:hypothetical protein
MTSCAWFLLKRWFIIICYHPEFSWVREQMDCYSRDSVLLQFFAFVQALLITSHILYLDWIHQMYQAFAPILLFPKIIRKVMKYMLVSSLEVFFKVIVF